MADFIGTPDGEILQGSAEDDVLYGLEGNDWLMGHDGNDTLIGGAGNDILSGKSGTNTAVFSGNLADYLVEWDLSQFTITDSIVGRDGTDTATDIHFFEFADITIAASAYQGADIDGTSGNDTLIGTSLSEVIRGLEGDDSIQGIGGARDSLDGGAGNDTIVGGAGNDLLFGGTGNDNLVGGDGADRIQSDVGNDVVDGGAGIDTYIAASSDAGVTVDLAGGTATDADGTDSVTGVENVDGTAANDDLTGDDQANTLLGFDGADFIRGGGGNDTLDGGLGDDTLEGGAGDDAMSAWDGNDVLAGDGGNDTLWGAVTAKFSGDRAEYEINYYAYSDEFRVTDLVAARDGFDTVYSSEVLAFADGTGTAEELGKGVSFDGDFGDHILYGTAGGDYINSGYGSNVVIWGYEGNDALLGTWGNNILYGGEGHDWLTGWGGGDQLNGGAGDDILQGNETWENDGGVIVGGDQNSVDGGTGTDTAVFEGNLSDYDISYVYELDVFTVHRKSLESWEGLTNLISVEYFQFADGTHAASDLAMTIVDGTEEDDDLEGTDDAEIFLGKAGNDKFNALGGDDLLYGGDGNDSLLGGLGDDRLYGGEGNDTLKGGEGIDAFWGDAGDDSIAGEGGSNVLHFFAATGSVSVNLKDGVTFGAFGNDVVSGIDFVDGGDYDDTLAGSLGGDHLEGRGGNDLISGDQGNDFLYGGKGSDTIAGGDGTNTLYGEEGVDTVSYQGSTSGMVVSLLDGTATGASQTDFLAGFENAFGSDFGDDITGDAWVNVLIGGKGNDALDGGAEIDTVVYAGNWADYQISFNANTSTFTLADKVADRDGLDQVREIEFFQFADGLRTAAQLISINGTSGNDTLNGTASADIISGLGGNDRINGLAGDDILNGGAGNDTMNGGGGYDTATYAGTAGAVKVSLTITTAQITGGAGTDTLTAIENLIGGDGNDVLTGNSLANQIEGGAGNDTLDGRAGADTMRGGTGNDLYAVDSAEDWVDEAAGEGIDTISSALGWFFLTLNLENLTLTGSSAISGSGNHLDNVLVGNGASNALYGEEGNDSLNGGRGADRLYGGKGSDTYFVDNALDQVIEHGSEGMDTVHTSVDHVLAANVEDLILEAGARNGSGNSLDNRITGSAGANVMNAQGGNDILDGKLGNDVLTGGAGADYFMFTTALRGNSDRITDFNAVNDTIGLDAGIFSRAGVGVLSADKFQASGLSFAMSSDVRIIFNTWSGALLYDADGFGGASAIQFATLALTGLAGPVSAADFVLL